MHGITNFPARLWFSKVSAPAFCTTPFLRVTRDYKPESILETFAPELTEKLPAPYKLTPQIMASNPYDFVRIAQWFLRFTDEVELNCGCPSPTVFGNGAGSSLLAETDKFHDFIATIVNEIGPDKLSVKMRTGIVDTDDFSSLVQSLNDLALKRLVVHGRTRSAGYTGRSDWQLIEQARKLSKHPVRGSGDINSWLQVKDLKGENIIGRGALRNPWIFGEIAAQKTVRFNPEVLKWSIGVWLALHFASSTDRKFLIDLAPTVLEFPVCFADELKWEELYFQLTEAIWGVAMVPQDLEVERFSMGFLKMMWNYLRSGLPRVYFQADLFKAKNPGDFFKILDQLAKKNPSLEMDHKADFDWVYAGRGQDPVHGI